MRVPTLQFIQIGDTGKTKKWRVVSSGIAIGDIGWYSHWRRYVVAPDGGTVWDQDCLAQVIAFIDEQMNARKGADV